MCGHESQKKVQGFFEGPRVTTMKILCHKLWFKHEIKLTYSSPRLNNSLVMVTFWDSLPFFSC